MVILRIVKSINFRFTSGNYAFRDGFDSWRVLFSERIRRDERLSARTLGDF